MKPKFIIVLTMILLAACGPTVPPVTTTPSPTHPPSPTTPPCSTSLLEPTADTSAGSRFPPVTSNEWSTGPADAAVTIVIYNDFQCTQCNDQVLMNLLAKYPKDIRLVYREFPQPDLFDKDMLAAQAAEAAGAQGKFWDMHNLLYDQQMNWVNLSPDDFKTWVSKQAQSLGLDAAKFDADFNSPEILAKLQKAVSDGKAAGIPVLPLVLINGQIYSAPKEAYAFDQVVRLTLLGKKQFASCPPMSIDPRKQYIATLKTVKGDIVIELYADKAPLAVNSFVFLARSGWFNGVTFHRVIPGFVAQTGDPSGTGLGGPGYVFRNEIDPSLRFDKPGMVGMANSGPDTNGSQFFITFAPQPDLNGYYTIFGHVLSGMDVLEKLTSRDPSQSSQLPDGDVILTVTIEEH